MRVQTATVFFILFVSYGFSSDTAVWQRVNRGIYENDIKTISVNPKNDMEVYIGTPKALYKSTDGGMNFKVILRPSGEQKRVNDIYIDPVDLSVIYAATDAGLYESRDFGEHWDRIYYASDPDSRKCLSVIRYKQTVYLGTGNGVFKKIDKESDWQNINGRFYRKSIYHIEEEEDFIYFATGQKVYSFNKQTSKIRQIFSMGIGKGIKSGDLSNASFDDRQDQYIKTVKVSSGSETYLVIGTINGVYLSADTGKDWQQLPSNNLAAEDITSLSVYENRSYSKDRCTEKAWGCLRILAGTKKGVFFLENEQWMPLYKGMETNIVNYLAENRQGRVYAATAKGIFYLSTGKTLPLLSKTPDPQYAKPTRTRNEQTHTDLRGRYGFQHEPTINEVHELAIHYAEVNREKIESWRKLARNKAFMPDLSVGLDRDASDMFHWNTGANPDELQKGRDLIDWDVNLSWDLADLVWSTDQTTIDSRSKLMVELREDILNEVTRLYFERRRVQIELISEDLNSPFRLDKEMRVAELTALIDALTGGDFSKKIH